jgi:hypothetical protein
MARLLSPGVQMDCKSNVSGVILILFLVEQTRVTHPIIHTKKPEADHFNLDASFCVEMLERIVLGKIPMLPLSTGSFYWQSL